MRLCQIIYLYIFMLFIRALLDSLGNVAIVAGAPVDRNHSPAVLRRDGAVYVGACYRLAGDLHRHTPCRPRHWCLHSGSFVARRSDHELAAPVCTKGHARCGRGRGRDRRLPSVRERRRVTQVVSTEATLVLTAVWPSPQGLKYDQRRSARTGLGFPQGGFVFAGGTACFTCFIRSRSGAA
jgi:hypothetical protein